MNSSTHHGAQAPSQPGDFPIDDWDDDSYAQAAAAGAAAARPRPKTDAPAAAPEAQEGSKVVSDGPISGVASNDGPSPVGSRPGEDKRPWRKARREPPPQAAAPSRAEARRMRDIEGKSPDFVHRTALFAASGPGVSMPDRAGEVARLGEASIKAAGPALTVWDKDAWLGALALWHRSGVALGAPFPASRSELARRAGLCGASGAATARIEASLARLAKCRVELAVGDSAASGHLLMRPRSGLLALDPGLMGPVVAGSLFFRAEANRKSLPRDALGRWLRDFLSTQSKPYPFHLARLRELTGATCRAEDFPKALERALERLCAPGGPLLSFAIDKRERRSDGWVLTYKLASSAKFASPRKAAGTAPPPKASAPRSPKRGGVAL